MRNYKNQNQFLEDKILVLEHKKRESFESLKSQFEITYQELRPSKLLIRALSDIKQEPEVRGNLFEVIISLTGGYLSNKIMVGKSHSLMKNIFGYVIQYFTTKLISRNFKN